MSLIDKWEIKWEAIIGKIKQMVSETEMKLKVVNIEVQSNPLEQYTEFMKVAKKVEERYDIVMCTRLLKDNIILWPNQNIQFCIRDGPQKVKITGNLANYQKYHRFRPQRRKLTYIQKKCSASSYYI